MKNKSFTLIELLVVIVIIGILAGVIMISTSSSIDKANFAKAQAFSSTIQNELLSNLVSEWTFDEGGEKAADSTADNSDVRDGWGSNHGTVHGDPKIKAKSDCVFGKCLEFDGDGDCININDSDSMRTSNNWTRSIWVKVMGVGDLVYSDFWSQRLTTNKFLLRWEDSTQKYGIYYYNATENFPKLNFDSTRLKWQFVVVVKNGVNISIYSNGSYVTGDSNAENFPEDNHKLYLGSNLGGTGAFLNGLIDDVRIYDAALSFAQIKQNYIAGLNSMFANGNMSKQEYNERINNLSIK